MGSDIRGKTPAELAYGKRADAEIVGSYDATRWVPEAEVIPPGIDLTRVHAGAAVRPRAPARRPRPVEPRARRAPSTCLQRCEGLPVELELVEGLPHDEARQRYEPPTSSSTSSTPAGTACSRSRRWRSASRWSRSSTRRPCAAARRPSASRCRSSPRRRTRCGTAHAARGGSGRAASPRRSRTRLRRAGPRHRAHRRPPARPLRSSLAVFEHLKRLAKHSAIYGFGGLVQRLLAVLLLPLYTSYLVPSDYGQIETVVAASAVVVIVLRGGISSAFFRFYFDSEQPEEKLRVVRTSFWYTMSAATAGLILIVAFASPDLGLAAPRQRRHDTRLRVGGGYLGADELRAADLALPGRGALGAVRDREPHERPDHDRRDRAPGRRLRQGAARRARRQLHRHADRLRRPRRLPPRAARARVRPHRCSGR